MLMLGWGKGGSEKAHLPGQSGSNPIPQVVADGPERPRSLRTYLEPPSWPSTSGSSLCLLLHPTFAPLFSFLTPTGRFSHSPLTYPSRCPYQQPVTHCGKWPSPRLDSCSYGRKQAATMARKFPYVLYSHKELSPVSLWPGLPGPGPETT